MSNTPEGKIKRKVVEVLKRNDVWYFFPASNGFGRAGIPDIIAIVDGRFAGIECKADPTKKPTKLQEQCGYQIRKAGGLWFLVRSAEDCSELETSIIDMRKRVVSVSSRKSKGSST